jgi:hypothetical protein
MSGRSRGIAQDAGAVGAATAAGGAHVCLASIAGEMLSIESLA